MPIAAGIFRQYDIRGVVGDDLTVDAAHAIGRAFATFLAHHGVTRPVAVGRDNRPSGWALRDSLVDGLTTSGVDVVDIGVVPTPLLYWSLSHLDVGAYFSETDAAAATMGGDKPSYEGLRYLVTSVRQGVVDDHKLFAWDYDENGIHMLLKPR